MLVRRFQQPWRTLARQGLIRRPLNLRLLYTISFNFAGIFTFQWKNHGKKWDIICLAQSPKPRSCWFFCSFSRAVQLGSCNRFWRNMEPRHMMPYFPFSPSLSRGMVNPVRFRQRRPLFRCCKMHPCRRRWAPTLLLLCSGILNFIFGTVWFSIRFANSGGLQELIVLVEMVESINLKMDWLGGSGAWRNWEHRRQNGFFPLPFAW